MAVERCFRREIGALDELFSFVDGFLVGRRPAGETLFNVRLIAEELFTNMVRHGAGRGEIAVRLDQRGGASGRAQLSCCLELDRSCQPARDRTVG